MKSFFTPLENVNEQGIAPSTRLGNANDAQELVDIHVMANLKRNKVDSKVFGLMSGNPPYRSSLLAQNGQSWRTNVNWRVGEALLSTALTQYWDVISSSPTLATIQVEYGTREEQEKWSEIVTQEFQRLNEEDPDLSYMFQLSQHDMVLFRMGPVFWEDTLDFRAKPVPQQYVYLLDHAKSNVNEWEQCVVTVNYPVTHLYQKILDPTAAEQAGWNVEAVRKALMLAAPSTIWPNNHRYDWLFYEKCLRNNDIVLSASSETVPVAWVFWKEFPTADDPEGSISQAAIGDRMGLEQYLYRRERKYANWKEVICPFYYDNGDGTHHSVKGLGIKSYGAMEAYNRLTCHLTDAAFFGSSLHFQAQTAADMGNLSVMPMGPYVWHPPGGTYLPTVQLGTALDGPMAIKNDLLSTLMSNLAMYRQNPAMKRGNPVTAREIDFRSENESLIGRSQMNRYFEQLDDFWAERFRRAANHALTKEAPGGKQALQFQHRCRTRGVPDEAFQYVTSVRATRSVGWGSADARSQALERLMARLPLYSEDGRRAILEDVTANDVGYALMRRYLPDNSTPSPEVMDQIDNAQQQIAGMKAGIRPVVSPTQNPMLYAQAFLKAGGDAVQSVQQGAKPQDVFNFLSVLREATAAQLQRLGQDPTRKAALKQLMPQLQQLSQVHDKLGQQLMQQAQQQRQQQMKAQQEGQAQQAAQSKVANQMKLASIQTAQKLKLKGAEAAQRMSLKDQQTQQKLKLADLTTAAKIRLQKNQQQAQSAATNENEVEDATGQGA